MMIMESVVEEEAGLAAMESIRGANPFLGLSPGQVAAAGARFALAAAFHPTVIAAEVAELTAERLRILAGTGSTEIPPGDRRFSDPAWAHPFWKRVAQLYIAGTNTVDRLVDGVGLDPKSEARARFATDQLRAALAPTNVLISNPAALKRALATRGRSLVDGVRNLADDVRHNGGLPTQVDTRPFVVGENIAATRGAVIHRTELFELIQYTPTTPKVRERPVLIVPPQVNKYYFLDLAPGRSFVEHAVGEGLQVFMISWRNPTPEQRDWSIDTYLGGILEATDVLREVTGGEDCNTIGFCAGGMSLLMLLSHLAAVGDTRINAVALGVTGVDTDVASTINMFASRRTVEMSVARSRRKGVLEGRRMSRVFAWVRPNDLIWNYVVNNWLVGNEPPAFDVLAWNADSTNLPAAFHAEFTNLFVDNALCRPAYLTALGTPVDLGMVKNDMYVVGAVTDHLVPWPATYAATQTTRGAHRFVLSNSGHIQALINPPGNPKASFFVGTDHPDTAEQWLAQAHRQSGSWWTDWSAWTVERSGPERPKRRSLGTKAHPALAAAPGRYVLQR